MMLLIIGAVIVILVGCLFRKVENPLLLFVANARRREFTTALPTLIMRGGGMQVVVSNETIALGSMVMTDGEEYDRYSIINTPNN
jgi:hypothetical protein